MWRVGPGIGGWRATLENAATGERYGFSSPQALCAWVWAQAEESNLGSSLRLEGDRER